STSPGADRVTVRLLKACWPLVKHTITVIYRKCLQLGYLPHAWKLTKVAMIPKVGKKDKISAWSWRPIALLSCLGKGVSGILSPPLTTRTQVPQIQRGRGAGAWRPAATAHQGATAGHDSQAGTQAYPNKTDLTPLGESRRRRQQQSMTWMICKTRESVPE
ncbi:hypothetical protein K504DRAFT_380719, partial [Pleomassaria siparia CBS 279.74]